MLRGTGISTHVPRTGHDSRISFTMRTCSIFQSTCPVRGTTRHHIFGGANRKNFNPRAPYGARPLHHCTTHYGRIHFNPRAPYGARPPKRARSWGRSWYFNPRAPYGARPDQQPMPPHPQRFQSTCPVRGTTSAAAFSEIKKPISIHVPRTGHDSKNAQIVFCIFAITDNKSGKVIM